MERYLRVNLLGPGPRLVKKGIYRAAVSQRLTNTGLEQSRQFLHSGFHPMRFLGTFERTVLQHKSGYRSTCVGIRRVPNVIQNCHYRDSLTCTLEDRMLSGIFGPKRDEVTWEWRKLHNEELNDL